MLLHKFIKQPYPFLFSPIRNFIVAFLLGVFIYLLNLISINDVLVTTNFNFSKQAVCIFAGLSTFLSTLLITEIGTRFFLNTKTKETWTVGKEFITIIILLFTIAIFNNIVAFIISKRTTDYNFFQQFVNAFTYAAGIGSLPTAIIIWFNYTILLKQNLKEVSLYNKQLEANLKQQDFPKNNTLKIETNNKNEVLVIDLANFLFAKAEGNYTDIFVKTTSSYKRTPYRINIQQLEDALAQDKHCIRTHRSYLVNLRNITSATGNARNYRLNFYHTDIEIPVSRSKFEAFKKAFNNMG
ncbi:DNA-binding LytR/AlgR family response regulator [Mesonia hippocampi]|uniref:DNA-binding LytR/AlgR family response regulator n=1 Tax=Mesonia hippocampi TaxID=1628250 RepID=A0A840EJH8_9FLAO|nr:LytTR family transcriptional regulator DNA-binding domain-containing protein [Mesonia hippocampi]MBB4119542.1 DNA-binding LytR/AlgR family response regulator [Mesonia hippocampi]